MDFNFAANVQHVLPEDCKVERNLHLCNDNTTCISLNELCDGVTNCPDSSDEGPKCNQSKFILIKIIKLMKSSTVISAMKHYKHWS